MFYDLSTNVKEELRRYDLIKNLGIDPERIDELIPPYPATGPTVLTFNDVAAMFAKKRTVDEKETNKEIQMSEEERERVKKEGREKEYQQLRQLIQQLQKRDG